MPGKCSCTIFPGMTVLKNQLIVCVANAAWSGDYAKSTVEIMKVLSADNVVLYVDPPYTWKDVLTETLKKRQVPFGRLLGLKSRSLKVVEQSQGSIYRFYAPPQLPAQFLQEGFLFNVLTKLNAFFFKKSVNKAVNRLGLKRQPILMVAFNPYAGLQLAGRLHEKALLYYCYDEIGHAIWISKHGPRLEKKLLQLSDAVFVSSTQLLADKGPFCKKSFLIKNGVNTSIFSQAFELHPTQGRRNVGFIGTLDDRVDYALLLDVVNALPDWQFLFTGRVLEPALFAPVAAQPNVKWSAPVPPDALPAILKTFDVGIIPFAKTGFTKAIYPLKINEYLIAGLPVVTTSFTQLDDFEAFCKVADRADVFAQMITSAVQDDNSKERLARFEFAKQNDWTARCKVFDQAAAEMKLV